MELPPSVQYLIFPWKQIEIGLRPCLWVRMLALSPPSASLEFPWLKVFSSFCAFQHSLETPNPAPRPQTYALSIVPTDAQGILGLGHRNRHFRGRSHRT